MIRDVFNFDLFQAICIIGIVIGIIALLYFVFGKREILLGCIALIIIPLTVGITAFVVLFILFFIWQIIIHAIFIISIILLFA